METGRSLRVVIAEPFSSSGLNVLESAGIEIASCVGGSRGALLEAVRDADGLIVRSETRVDAELLQCASRLVVIGRAGVGVDAIDVTGATQAGIVVVNTPAANTLAATEQTFALLLALLRHTAGASTAIRAGRWERSPFIGSELYGKTLGIVGLGRIGSEVASRARAFGMTVIACDPYVADSRARAQDVSLVLLDELLRDADIVTLHLPLNAQTKNLMGREQFLLMKPQAVFVNCARGGLVDEPALLAALDAGRLRAAAIDVIAHEPPEAGDTGARLHAHPNVLATPHLGGSTHEALERIAVELAQDVVNVLQGRPAAGAVNAPIPTGADAQLLRPFVDLAYRMGLMLPQLGGPQALTELSLALGGSITQADPRPLVTALLSGLLQNLSERRVSVVNSDRIAEELGLRLSSRTDQSHGAFAGWLRLTGMGHEIVGSILHSGPRVVEIDGYEVDTAPEGTLVVTRHRDVPGMIGRVGTLLGEGAVNISTMQVARNGRGDALMLLAIDRPISKDIAKRLNGIAGMQSVQLLRL
ncbi:MAG: phosphoglycerate dehydrogenase [Candidatus Eremiobacteraeota bacterium]|nr:phosphoglycerate dehydrogenase [Candidatus Eremiobacteraeota bacterium]